MGDRARLRSGKSPPRRSGLEHVGHPRRASQHLTLPRHDPGAEGAAAQEGCTSEALVYRILDQYLYPREESKRRV
jgi:hypothetical protein